jgi:hypothetical protein
MRYSAVGAIVTLLVSLLAVPLVLSQSSIFGAKSKNWVSEIQ